MDKSPDKQHDVSRIVAEIKERGYCIVPSVISPEKADEARAILERLLEDEMTDENRAAKTQRVSGIAYKHPIFTELLAHPLIVAICQSFLDDKDVVCSTWAAPAAWWSRPASMSKTR